jgi:hypothetical protein
MIKHVFKPRIIMGFMVIAFLMLIIFMTKSKETLKSQPLLPDGFTGIALLYDGEQGQCNQTDGCKELWDITEKLQRKYPYNVAVGDSNKPNYHFELLERDASPVKLPAIVGFRKGKFDSAIAATDASLATAEQYLLSLLEP